MARIELRCSLPQLRTPSPAAHQRRDLRLRWQRAVCHGLPRGAANLPDAPVRAATGLVHVLWLATGHPSGGGDASAGHHLRKGIRGAGMARRPADRSGVGGFCRRVLRHRGYSQGASHLRGQLVLRSLHHRRGLAAHRQQRGHSGKPDQELFSLRGGAGCHGAVVVRPQRRGLLPHRWLSGDHVLLHPQAGRASGVQLSTVHRALLGTDLHLHVGRPPPPALHRLAGLGAVHRHDLLAGAAGAELGRHDQRDHDALGRLAQTA